MADCIRMLFGVVNGVGRGMGVLDEDDDRQRRKGSFGGKLWTSHCNKQGQRRAVTKLLWGGLVKYY